MAESQISAFVSEETRDLLERHVRATGSKKGFVVEQALRHHLLALAEVPADVVIHPRIVVSAQSMEAIAKQLRSPKRPTKALRELMSPDGD